MSCLLDIVAENPIMINFLNLKRFYWTEPAEDAREYLRISASDYTPEYISPSVFTTVDGGNIHDELREEKEELIRKLIEINEPD